MSVAGVFYKARLAVIPRNAIFLYIKIVLTFPNVLSVGYAGKVILVLFSP